MKIAYCGYDFFHACLRGLIGEGHEICQIYTFPCDGQYNYNSYINDIASENNIPVTEDPVTEEDIKRLQQEGVECLITAAYPHKIPDLTVSTIKGFNVHPTLLPQGRGVWPLPWIILNQLNQSGVTLHKLTSQWDAGDVLMQQSFPVSDTEVLESLSCKVQLLARELLMQVMATFDAVWGEAKPQVGDVSMWPMPQIKDRYIRWDMNVAEIDLLVRAFGKFSALAVFDDVLWNIFDVAVWQEVHSYEPGTRVHMTNTEMVIAAADGLVCLRYFQRCEDQSLLIEVNGEAS